MPFTVYCGACRQPIVLHEGHAGQVVRCPLCGAGFVVPGALQPVPAPQLAQPQPTAWDASQVAEDEPPRPRYRQSSNLGVLVAVGLAALFLVAATALAGWWVLRGQQKDETVKATPVARASAGEATDPPLKHSAKPKVELPKAPSPELPKAHAPEPPKPLTFGEAYAEAVRIGQKLDAEEPAKTEKALAVLTITELLSIGQGQFRSTWPLIVPQLQAVGLTDFLQSKSRAVAQADPKFRPMAERLWDKDSGAAGILVMMGEWGQIPEIWRYMVIDAVQTGNRQLIHKETRDYILRLGGRKWLEQRR